MRGTFVGKVLEKKTNEKFKLQLDESHERGVRFNLASESYLSGDLLNLSRGLYFAQCLRTLFVETTSLQAFKSVSSQKNGCRATNRRRVRLRSGRQVAPRASATSMSESKQTQDGFCAPRSTLRSSHRLMYTSYFALSIQNADARLTYNDPSICGLTVQPNQ